jgi:hypothetical protein
MESQFGVYGSGGRAADAVRHDGAVLKTAGPWAGGVIALLRHLENVGFGGAPRVLGDGYSADGRLAVSYVPGESPHPRAWPESSVSAIGELLRRLHDATRNFTPPAGVQWQRHWLRDLDGPDRVIGHGDAGPWNIVGPPGQPSALIDWEFAGPIDARWELAEATWLNAQLHDDDIAASHGLPDAAGRARQVRAIVDGYGLRRADRADFVDRLVDVAVHSARAEALSYDVTMESSTAVAPDGYPVLWAIAWRARSASWIARHRGLLRRALT